MNLKKSIVELSMTNFKIYFNPTIDTLSSRIGGGQVFRRHRIRVPYTAVVICVSHFHRASRAQEVLYFTVKGGGNGHAS